MIAAAEHASAVPTLLKHATPLETFQEGTPPVQLLPGHHVTNRAVILMLMHCRAGNRAATRSGSWAPDWSINPSRRQQTYLRPASNASGGLRPNCSFPSDRTMRVTGIILGKVDTVSPCRLGEEDDLQPERMTSAELEEVIYRCKSTSKHVYNFYRGQSLALEAYCRTLQVGWCRDDFVHDMYSATYLS